MNLFSRDLYILVQEIETVKIKYIAVIHIEVIQITIVLASIIFYAWSHMQQILYKKLNYFLINKDTENDGMLREKIYNKLRRWKCSKKATKDSLHCMHL